MRVVVQRVRSSAVTVNGRTIGAIARGLNLLVGIAATDTEAELDWIARKCLNLRLFPDDADKPWSKSILDLQGEILVVSQFTLYGDCAKGRRPFLWQFRSARRCPSPSTIALLLKLERKWFGDSLQGSLAR